MRDANGRPLPVGDEGGGGTGCAAVHGLSWAGPRGAVVHAGRSCLGISPDGSAELCFLAAPASSRRESLACQVWRGMKLPSLEGCWHPSAHIAPSVRIKASGWGADGAEDIPDSLPTVEGISSPPPDGFISTSAAPQVLAPPPMTVRVGGWETPSTAQRTMTAPAAIGNAPRVVHEALTTWH